MKKQWTGTKEQDTRSVGEKINTRVSRLFSESLAGAFLTACVLTLLYQAYHWLFHGAWLRLPLKRFLYQIPGFGSWEWLHDPDKWFTLHRIVSFILDFGLAAFFGLLAAVSVLIGTALRED